jgi:DNA adenine methylase
MEYITAQEAANKWCITRRRVQILCAEGRVDGSIKKANLWLIPSISKKPIDKRSVRYSNKELLDRK